MEKEITIISYDREKASTIINCSQSLEDLRNQLKEEIEQFSELNYCFLDKKKNFSKISKAIEKKVKIEDYVDDDKIIIKDSLKIHFDNGDPIEISIDRNQKISNLRDQIKKKSKELNNINFAFYKGNKTIEIKEELEKNIKDIISKEDDNDIIDRIYIKELIQYTIKKNEKNDDDITIFCPKDETLSNIRERYKERLKNYKFLNKKKNIIELNNELFLKVSEINQNDEIFVKKDESEIKNDEKESHTEYNKINEEEINIINNEEDNNNPINILLENDINEMDKEKETETEKETEKETEMKDEKKKEKEKENGIIFERGENIKDFLNIDIKTKLDQLEIYNLEDEKQKGYKFMKLEEIENNLYLYYLVCPIYENIEKVNFGIRNYETKMHITDDAVNNDKLIYDRNKEYYTLYIEKENDKNISFNIFNEPNFNENNILTYLQNLYELDNYYIEFSCIKKALNIVNSPSIIIDKIMELGDKHKLTDTLINILKERDIDIYTASYILENDKKKYEDEQKKYKKFSDVAPYIIKALDKLNKNSNNVQKKIQKKIFFNNEELILCCNKNIPSSIEPLKLDKNLIEDIKKNLEEENFSQDEFDKYRENIKKKIENINNNIDIILTEKTLKKIYKIELGIMSNIPIIIQGFVSSGKSYLSKVVLKMNKRKYEATVLSEYTTEEDLLGRDNIDKESNSVTFCPGILLNSYTEGKTLILDEGDLAKPEVLSCIIGSITKNSLIVRNKTYLKNDDYNIIITMNGESKGFNEKQRNILTSNILSKFVIINFEEIDKEESKEIFEKQLEKLNDIYKTNKSNFIELHERMIEMMEKKETTIDPIVTLRNLNNYIYFDENEVSPRIAGEISYTARFPKNEKTQFEDLLNKFGNFEYDEEKKKKILKYFDNEKLVCDENHKKVMLKFVYLALVACEAGFHPLLIGKEGSGLTKLAKLVASIHNNGIFEFLLCNSETSDEDLIGNYQPGQNEILSTENLSSLIHWRDGSILKGLKKGSPVILDDINYSKPQIIESLNSLLESNLKHIIKHKKDYKYTILQKCEDKEIIINKKNFVIIGTMKYDDRKKKENITKALMNRFVAIYLDEMIIDKDNIDIVITKTVKGLKDQNNIKLVKKKLEKELNEIIEEFKKIFKKEVNENIKYNLKSIIRKIQNLYNLYDNISKYKFSIEKCYNLLNFHFDTFNNKEIEYFLRGTINKLEDSQKSNSFFFFDKNDNNTLEDKETCKMMLGLIISGILNKSIFLQGSPGSGKSCAARYYGANRNFKSRDPIISINCHRDLLFDSLIGNFSFKNSKFEFIEGPLLMAIKNGEIILLDEFNLCSENVLVNLVPILKSNINEEIYIKGVPYKVKIQPGFLIIATGNSQNEKGRKIIGNYILNELNVFEIKNTDLNYYALGKIMKEKYEEILLEDKHDIYKISLEQIKGIRKTLLDFIQKDLSIRQIKCLLSRIQRFTDSCEGKVPVIYIIISYIMPQLNIENEQIEKLLEKLNEIMKYNNLNELKDFLYSEVRIEKDIINKNNYIKKGIIRLSTSLRDEYIPQVILQTYFWIRMSCRYINDKPSEENLLLIGTTSYKEYILNKWLQSTDKSCQTYFLTKNTEVQNLIGISSLDDDKKLKNLKMDLFNKSKEPFPNINLEDKDLKIISEKNKESILYIHEIYKKINGLLENLINSKGNLKTVTSFHLGIVTLNYIFGKTLVLKGIENPHPSVIERLNSVLEIPRNLVLIEDSQKIYNDENIFKKIYGKNKNSLPLHLDFGVIMTSRNSFNKSLSKAFLSRITSIYCPNYKDKLFLNIKFEPKDNYNNISKNILSETSLQDEINIFKEKLDFEVEVLSFIRWCKTTKYLYESINNYEHIYINDLKKKTNMYKNNKINFKYLVGISALRTIIDKYDLEERKRKVEQYFKDYLPEKLYDLIVNKNFKKETESPFDEIVKNETEIYIFSKYSEIILKISRPNKEIKKDYLKNIIWTNSTIDIADAILISLAANTILILEGPPGRGKTQISKDIFEYLNIETTRINFSPSTTKEDVFSKIIPKIEDNKISTKREDKELIDILRKSFNCKEYYKYGLILDEMNLSKDDLLEDLYSYLISIKKDEKDEKDENRKYTSPDGDIFTFGKIGVIVNMNGSNMSNSRTSLSGTFLSLCHSFKLSNYTKEEKIVLTKEKLKNFIDEESEIKYINNNIYNKKNNTFRELIKLIKLFKNKNIMISIDQKINLISEPEIDLKIKANLRADNDYLYLGEYVKYPLIKNKNKAIRDQFTSSQKEALARIMIGLNIEKPILLTGEIGCGKTFIIEELSKLVGVNLKIIQFNYETTSYDLIGRLELNKKNLDDLRKVFNEVQDVLIEKLYPLITKYLLLGHSMETSKLNEFLKNEADLGNFLKDDKNTIEKVKELKIRLKNNSNLINNINFGFNFSILINAMKNGDWILLDDINFAPQEIERLMSLLEEEPTLTIHENEPTLTYKRNNDKKEEEIHKNFRIILTSSNENNISTALKSRCFHVKMKSYNNPEDYAIILANILINSRFKKDDVLKIAKNIGNAFYNLKKKENPTNYILKNYILNPINLVNLSKLLVKNYYLNNTYSTEINGKLLASYLRYSVFSVFNYNKKKESINLFKNNLLDNKKINIEINENKQLSYEYYLSKYEILILSYYCKENFNKKEISEEKKKEFIENNINNKIEERISKKSNFNSDKIDHNIDENNITEEIIKIRDKIIKDLELFTFKEISNYSEEIDEVIKIFKMFIQSDSEIYAHFYFLIYLKKFLEKIKNIGNDNYLCDKELKKYEEYKKYIKKEEDSEKLTLFRNMITAFNDIIPKKIKLEDYERSIIELFYKYYRNHRSNENNQVNIYFKILSHSSLKPLLKKYNIIFPKNEELKKELFYILLNSKYDISIEENNLINIIGKGISLYLNEINQKYINDLKSKLKFEKKEYKEQTQYIFNEQYIIYDYPSEFYNYKDLSKIYWYHQIFLLEIVNEEDLKTILSSEIFEFNKGIKIISKKKEWKNIKTYIEKGYKFFEGIRDIKEEKIDFHDGIDLFKDISNERECIIKALNEYKILQSFFSENNNEEIFVQNEQLKKKINLLNKRLGEYKARDRRQKYENELNDIKRSYKDLGINNHYIETTISKVDKLLKKENFNEEEGKIIENYINQLKQDNSQYKSLKERMKKEEEKNKLNFNKNKIIFPNKTLKQASAFAIILYNYSKLCSIVDEIKSFSENKNKNNKELKYLRFKFNEISKMQMEKEIFIKLRIENAENKNIDEDQVELYHQAANSYLINEIYNSQDNKNDGMNKFADYLKNIICLKDEILDLNIKFGDDEYIYLPKLSISDLKFTTIQNDFILNLNDQKKQLKDLFLEFIQEYEKRNGKFSKEYIYFKENKSKIEELYKIDNEELKKKFYNNNIDWLISSFDQLKNESWKKPNTLLIKKKYNLYYENKDKIFDEKKIHAKALYALYLGNQKGKTKDWITFPAINIHNLSNPNKENINYGYRIMDLYEFKDYRDISSETMIYIIDSVDKIFSEIFKDNIISKDIRQLLCQIYEDFIINYIFKEESPNLENSKIMYIIQYIMFIIVKKYKSIYESEKDKCQLDILTQKNSLISNINDIYNNLIKEIEENAIKFEKRKKSYDEFIESNKKKYKELFIKNNIFSNINENSYDFDEKYKNSKEYEEYLQLVEEKRKPEKENWDEMKQHFEVIKNDIEMLKEKNNNNEIMDLLNNNKLDDLENPNLFNLIDKTRYENYKQSKKKLIEKINELSNLENKNKELNFDLEDINNFQIIKKDEFSEKNLSDDYTREELIKLINNYKKYNFNIFEINDFKDFKDKELKNDLDLNQSNNKIKDSLAQNINFIFIKDNKPIFLYNYMKIDLGLYILDDAYNIGEIGSVIIPNNSIYPINYILKGKNNEIILSDLLNKGKQLKTLENLVLKFTIDKYKLSKRFDFYKSEFELIIKFNKGDESKCQIDVCINVIPLILKFSLKKENYLIKNKKIYIHHYIPKLIISYIFPGNYFPKLSLLLRTNNKENISFDSDKNEIKKKGQIIINSNYEDETLEKYELSLSLNKKLFDFVIECQKPKRSGLIIFDKNREIVNEDKKRETFGIIKIKNGEEKEIYIFNMSYYSKDLKIKTDKNTIQITKIDNQTGKRMDFENNNFKIKPGQLVSLNIKNINCIDGSITINDDLIIKIRNIEPKLQSDGENIFCTFNDKKINDSELYDIEKYKLFIICNNTYKLNEEKINGYSEDYFSAFLICNKEIVDKKIKKKYEFIKVQENDKVFGFEENENVKLSEASNMAIILAYYKDNLINESVFTDEQREDYKCTIENPKFLDNIKSNDLKHINEAIEYLIKKNINLDKDIKEIVENLEITNEKTSYINIIIYLMKYSLKFKEVDEFKKNLENNFEKIYSHRDINEYFEPNQSFSGNTFLKNFSYILSFVSLILSPGEILINEIIEKNEKTNKNEIELTDYNEIYERYYKKSVDEDINNTEFIYYNGEISLDKFNEEFDKFENQIKSKLNYKSLIKIEAQDEYFDCSKEIDSITENIKNNKINFSNLLHFLELFKKYIISIPFILSKKERQQKCIIGSQLVYDFLKSLKTSNIYNNTIYNKKIDEYFNIIEEFLSKFEIFNIHNVNHNKKIDLNFIIEECKLPFDDEPWKIENKSCVNRNADENPKINKNYSVSSDNNKTDQNKKKEKEDEINDKKEENKDNNFLKVIRNEKFQEIDKILRNNPDNKKTNDVSQKYKYLMPQAPKNLNPQKPIKIVNDYKELNTNGDANFKVEQVKDNFNDIKTPTAMLRFIFNLVKNNNKSGKVQFYQRFGCIRKEEEIHNCYIQLNKRLENETIDINSHYLDASVLIQNMISNSIKEKIIDFNNGIFKVNTLEYSYIDIAIDITQIMSEQQEISALIICIGLCKSLTKYGVKIRISVFGERNNVWLLSENFDNNKYKINRQILRLRDALSCHQKRLISFPADALVKLKKDFEDKKYLKKKYIQILISSFITAQVIDEEIDWNIISQKIFIFTLKSKFEEEYRKKIEDENKLKIEDNLLNVHYSSNTNINNRSSNVTQEFFSPSYINENTIKGNINEKNKYENIITEIIESLLMEDEGNKSIIIERLQNENKLEIKNYKEIINKNLIDYITSNKNDDKYFAQNKKIFLSKKDNENRILNELLKYDLKTTKSEYNLPLEKNHKEGNENLINQIITFDKIILSSCFNNYFEKNVASKKILCSSGGNISIKGLLKWICSGFTYSNIFEKKGGKDKKIYHITFIIDLSESILLDFNYTHAIGTIIIMLISPLIIENNEEIYINIIINTYDGVKIIEYNTKCMEFKNYKKINDVLNIIFNSLNNTCCPGSCLYSAYKLLIERREEKKIFLITDGFLTNKFEIFLTLDLMDLLENNEIELITIGVGTYPYPLNKIFPKFIFTSSFKKIYECLSICFNNSVYMPLESLNKNLINNEKIEYKQLLKFKNDVFDCYLKEDIEKKEIYLHNMIFNNYDEYVEVETEKEIKNANEFPYKQIVNGLINEPIRILVVILYLGGNQFEGHITKDDQVSEEIFIKNSGRVLKEFGFEYTLVYNYNDAINELTDSKNDHCKYFETWIFCSDGSGNTPVGGKKIYYSDESVENNNIAIQVKKEDNEIQLIPFLETVASFNKSGGALLLFCDNEPFVLEANLLLNKYLHFEETKNGSANFKMGGNYMRKKEVNSNISIYKDEYKTKCGTYEKKELLETPGSAKRYSLRIGIEQFFEGETLSYAKKIDNNSNYEPFSPFAYLTDKTKEKPFILYYDPKIKEDGLSRGPIIVHGGSTSAFYEFEKEGAGKLIISSACWLLRIEEILKSSFIIHSFKERFIPKIEKSKSNEKFQDWISAVSTYTILILDVSGSMEPEYKSLVEMTNEIILNQKNKEENEGIIIFFATNAETIRKGKYSQIKLLEYNELKNNKLGGGTCFLNGFNEAKKYLYSENEFILKRVIFLTDGEDSQYLKIKEICQEMKNNNFKIIFLGLNRNHKFNYNQFKNLEELPHDYININTEFKAIKDIILKIFQT